MLPGDVVESIDGVSLRSLNQDELLDLLRGEPGQNAHLKLRRNDADIELDVKREVIRTRTVRILRLNENVLYARVSHFRAAATASELASGLRTSLLAGPRPKLWIMDLRMNPGGAVSEVSSVASLFVPFGQTILGVSSRLGVEMHTSAPPKDEAQWQQLVPLLSGVPLVVLVDARTGSGAEVLAHILRERMGAKTAGEPTAQLDNVLKYFDLRGQAAVQLTFGHLVSSSGRREYSSGVPLDVVLEATPHGEFGDPRTDGMLAKTLERFAN